MVRNISKDKTKFKFNALKEVGYILLILTFFVGVILGSFNLKNVDETSFNEYSKDIYEGISEIDSKEFSLKSNTMLYNGVKVIFIYWIVGMSVLGVPILVIYLGYKGYSVGYTISTIIKILGVGAGNKFVFKYLFIKNMFLIFIMIFLANFAIKMSRDFFEDKSNIKANCLKYTAVTAFTAVLWIVVNVFEKIILVTF